MGIKDLNIKAHYIVKKNNYEKKDYKIGDILFRRYIIKQIIDKGLYNMYICKDKRNGCRTSFTDMDL